MPAEGRLSTPERAEKTYGGRGWGVGVGRPRAGGPLYLPYISPISPLHLTVGWPSHGWWSAAPSGKPTWRYIGEIHGRYRGDAWLVRGALVGQAHLERDPHLPCISPISPHLERDLHLPHHPPHHLPYHLPYVSPP